MRYWYDPYHYSLAMGTAMQQAMIGTKAGDTPENFFVRMSPDMVARHIKVRRDAIVRWAQANPELDRKSVV